MIKIKTPIVASVLAMGVLAIMDMIEFFKVEIIDHGSGIPVEFHQHMFQKFSQADSSSSRKQEGTGLGLSICKAIIDRHKGTINFKTKLNEGTTFYFTLPKAMKED